MSYKRILLKLSGEVLAGSRKYGIDPLVANKIAKIIKKVKKTNIELAIVIGGGNIFMGISVSAKGMDRVAADYLGMLATVMNSVALQSELEKMNCDTRVMSALSITQLAEPYIRRRATRHLEKGRVVICAGGTGNPYFTTDTAAVLRAIEINADIIISALGVPNFIKAEMIKDGVVVIDVGITRVEDLTKEKGYKIVGDVDFESVKLKSSFITPVPGGVGPMTIAMLLKNTLKARKNQ